MSSRCRGEFTRLWLVLACVMTGCVLTGCEHDSLEALDERLAAALTTEWRQPAGELPESVELPILHYLYAESRSPFRFAGQVQRDPQGLAAFALDELTLVGVLERQSQRWALFETPGGRVHAVMEGQSLASPAVKVAAIEPDAVRLEADDPEHYAWRDRLVSVGEGPAGSVVATATQ